jgi:hypothetical protein
MWQDDRGKGPAAEHVNDYQFPLSFYVNFIICLYNFIEITLFLLKLYVVAGHVDHDSADEEGLYSSPDLMVLIKKKIIKANKELASLLDRPDQTPDVLAKINLLMSQLNTYKVITII